MASSNRHWPSMFKSKPCNTHHQWQHDINPSLISSACHRTPYTTGSEERSPEPKPRWNPKPEQIRILEAIFNSGMVNPPRDEIRKIRAQLQEYGQVGDANVFYWFQNRKSRSKHKLRHLQNSKQEQSNPIKQTPQITASSSSSSSEKSSPNGSNKTLSIGSLNVMDVSNSPTASVNQTYFQTHGEFLPEPFFLPVNQSGGASNYTQGFCFSELSNVVQANEQSVGPCTSLLLGEIMNHGNSRGEQEVKMKMQPQMSYNVTTSPSCQNFIPSSSTVNVASTINPIQDDVESGSMGHISGSRSTVFINDVAFEVAIGPFNVKEAFGEDAMLINSNGQPVLTNDWGLTFQPLQHGAFYYLICMKQCAWGSARENMEDNLIL